MRPLALDEKASKLLDEAARETLKAALADLEGVEDWQVSTIEAAVRETAGRLDLKLGKVAQPLRAALTGRTVSPSVFEVMYVLRRDETLARIGDQLA